MPKNWALILPTPQLSAPSQSSLVPTGSQTQTVAVDWPQATASLGKVKEATHPSLTHSKSPAR